MSVLQVAAGLQELDCPFLAQLDIHGTASLIEILAFINTSEVWSLRNPGTVDWVSSLLLTPGEERSGLLAWCGDRLAREDTSSQVEEHPDTRTHVHNTHIRLQAWLSSSGCCSRESQAVAFLQGSLGRRQQLQVTVSDWSRQLH